MNNVAPADISTLLPLVIKVMTISALVVYALFALILISQIRIKRQTVTTELGGFLEVIAYIHFALISILIIVSFFIL